MLHSWCTLRAFLCAALLQPCGSFATVRHDATESFITVAKRSHSVDNDRPMMTLPETVRAVACWGNPQLIDNQKCLEWLADHCKEASTGMQICADFKDFVKRECEGGGDEAEAGCYYAKELGIEVASSGESDGKEKADAEKQEKQKEAGQEEPKPSKDKEAQKEEHEGKESQEPKPVAPSKDKEAQKEEPKPVAPSKDKEAQKEEHEGKESQEPKPVVPSKDKEAQKEEHESKTSQDAAVTQQRPAAKSSPAASPASAATDRSSHSGVPSAAPAPSPVVMPTSSPAAAKPTPPSQPRHQRHLNKALPHAGLPDQGMDEHSTDWVEHSDQATATQDWGQEWPHDEAEQTIPDSKEKICQLQPKLTWCKLFLARQERKRAEANPETEAPGFFDGWR